MKWLKFTQNPSDKNNFFVPHGDEINNIVGQTIKNVTIREDAQDMSIELSGGELRVFGKALCPSFSANVQAHPRASEDSETPKDALRPLGEASCSASGFTGDVGSGRLGDSSWLKDVVKAERLMGVYEFFDWYQEFRKRLWAKRASYLENHLKTESNRQLESGNPL